MNKKFDLDKAMANGGKCRTRAGRSARIICTDVKGSDRSILALFDEDGGEYSVLVLPNGQCFHGEENHDDLINIPERYVLWMNYYSNTSSYGYKTREEADSHAAPNRIACIRIEFEEGEGLE